MKYFATRTVSLGGEELLHVGSVLSSVLTSTIMIHTSSRRHARVEEISNQMTRFRRFTYSNPKENSTKKPSFRDVDMCSGTSEKTGRNC